MIEQIGGFIGMLAADVRNFFRGRQAVPCSVDWDNEPDGDPDITDSLTKTSRPKYALLDDGCGTCDTDCCLSTDTLGEMREWNQRK